MDHWGTYLFQYGVGGVFFLVGLLAGTLGADDPEVRRDHVRFVPVLVGGLAAYAAGHALWTILAIRG